jgi:hypothetical protein
MRDYFKSVWFMVGLALLVFGSGPLFLIMFAATVGLRSDPNPNPIAQGFLFGVTIWPAIICLVVGVIRVRKRQERGQ